MDCSGKIKQILKKLNIKQNDLAKATNQSKGNLSNKLVRNNFTVFEFEELINALGCKLQVNIILPTGETI